MRTTAGTFLANHYATLGPYFGDKNGNDWPHSPFVNEPTQLELDFNEKMMKITEIMSNGTLEDVSILDLPAFGSSVARFDKHHRIMSNWPTEVNFEIFKHNQKDRLVLLTEYKDLLEDWENYMIKIFRNDSHASFTPLMEKNELFDFTRYIKADMKTFLLAMHGSFLTPSNETLLVWKKIAHEVFAETLPENVVSNNGLYDKLIMQCALRRNLRRRQVKIQQTKIAVTKI